MEREKTASQNLKYLICWCFYLQFLYRGQKGVFTFLAVPPFLAGGGPTCHYAEISKSIANFCFNSYI